MNRADRMRTLGVLFTIIAVVIIFFGYSPDDISKIYGQNALRAIICGLLLLSIIVLTYFWGSIDEFYKSYKNKKNKLSNTVISKRTSVIHILDTKGENATYFEKVSFYKIDKRNPYISDVFADSSNQDAYISNPQIANCTTNYSKKITFRNFI